MASLNIIYSVPISVISAISGQIYAQFFLCDSVFPP